MYVPARALPTRSMAKASPGPTRSLWSAQPGGSGKFTYKELSRAAELKGRLRRGTWSAQQRIAALLKVPKHRAILDSAFSYSCVVSGLIGDSLPTTGCTLRDQ